MKLFNLQILYFIKMVPNGYTDFILLAIYLLFKTDFPLSCPYLFESNRLSLIGSLGCYAMEYVSLMSSITKKKTLTFFSHLLVSVCCNQRNITHVSDGI